MPIDPDEIAKKYGGQVSVDDIAAKYGGSVVGEVSDNAKPAAIPESDEPTAKKIFDKDYGVVLPKIDELGKQIKLKNPGVYDNVSDQEAALTAIKKHGSISSSNTGLLSQVKSYWRRNAPEMAQDFLDNLISLGNMMGLNEPAIAVGGVSPKQFVKGLKGATSGITAIGKKISQYPSEYKQATQTLKDIPIKRSELALEATEARSALSEAKRQGIDAAKAAVTEELESKTKPLAEQATSLKLAKRDAATALTKEDIADDLAKAEAKNKIEASRTNAEAAVKAQTEQQVSGFTKAQGVKPTSFDVSEAAAKSRKANLDALQGEIRATHKGIMDIAEKPENKVIKTIKEEVNDPYRSPDEPPKIVTREIEGPAEVNVSNTQQALAKTADNVRGQIQAAINQGSPGAKALIQLVDGEGAYTVQQALDIRAALNQIGYAGDRALVGTKSQALAKQAVRELNKDIRAAIEKLPSGADEAKALLDQEAQLLAKRKVTFDDPMARGAASVMKSGDATVFKNPVKLKKWMDQVDEPTRQMARSQVVHEVLGKSPEKFADNWNKMDPEIKALWFNEEQIKLGDRIASSNKAGLEKIAKEFELKNQKLANQAIEKSAAIRTRRSELSKAQTKIEELQAQIKEATGESKKKLEAAEKALQNDYNQKIASLRRETSLRRQEFIRQQQWAEAKIKQIDKVKRIGWMAVGALVGSGAYSAYNGIHSALSNP